MCKTTNCHIKDIQPGDVYCGRGKGSKWNPKNCNPVESGYWGNPIAVNKECPVCRELHKTGGSTLPCYEEYLTDRLSYDSEFSDEFIRLQGETLACFCKPKACHTDIMIKYLDME